MSESSVLAPIRKSSGVSHSSPSSSFTRESQARESLALRMPPAGLKPTLFPVFQKKSLMARSITIATGKVAFTVSFPVEVLIKSDPLTVHLYNPTRISSASWGWATQSFKLPTGFAFSQGISRWQGSEGSSEEQGHSQVLCQCSS